MKRKAVMYGKIVGSLMLILIVSVILAFGIRKINNGESPVSNSGRIGSSISVEAATKSNPASATAVPSKMTFVDAHGDKHKFKVDKKAKMTVYDKNIFVTKNGFMTYRDTDNYETKIGIDVSYYQYNIDWNKVKKAGIDFAIIRIGYRGYSNGTLVKDSKFERNYKLARKAGVKVGVYIFAQAVNVREAAEEARFVLNILNGRKLDYPVMYDPETIMNAKARTDNVSGAQFTKNTVKFCKVIEDAGYDYGVYANLKWQAYLLKMSKIKNIPMWYADYEKKPQTPYAFEYWQYTSQGSVPGVAGNCDMNIQMIPLSDE